LKSPLGELVVALGLRVALVVDAEVPVRVLAETVLLEEAILVLCRRPVLAPGVSVDEHRLLRLDQTLRVVICLLVQRHCHDGLDRLWGVRDDDVRSSCFASLAVLSAEFGEDIPYRGGLDRGFAFRGSRVPFLN
jgi:hypothetical protein